MSARPITVVKKYYKTKNKNKKTMKKEQQSMFETKWWYYRNLVFVFLVCGFCPHFVSNIGVCLKLCRAADTRDKLHSPFKILHF